jgi:arginase
VSILLIQVPHHLDRGAVAEGRGPVRYIDAGAERVLREARHDVDLALVEPAPPGDLMQAVLHVDHALAEIVRGGAEHASWPLVLAADCHSCLGTLAGLGTDRLGVVWLDAHGDFNTPQTSPSGYFDGMCLAVAVGLAHEPLRDGIGLARPIAGERILLAGTRDLDPGERENLRRARVPVVEARALLEDGPDAIAAPLDRLAAMVRDVYLHIDIDVVDPHDAPGVSFPVGGGLAREGVEAIVQHVARRFRIRGAALTAYNPEKDDGDRTLRLGLRILAALAGAQRAVQQR